MWDPVAELTRAFLPELNIGVTAFTIVGATQCFSCSNHSRPSTWRRTCGYTQKYCRVCRLGGTFYFLLSFYSILYRLSSTTTCQMSHNSGFIDKKCYCYCYYYPWRIMCHNPHLFLMDELHLLLH